VHSIFLYFVHKADSCFVVPKLEDEIGVSDAARGIFGFVDQFSAALKWGLRVDATAWTTCAANGPLPLLLQFDFSKGQQKRGSSMLEGCLKVTWLWFVNDDVDDVDVPSSLIFNCY
jgi:hypothetical protein